MLADTQLVSYFEDGDMTRQRGHQTAFISAVTGGPGEYDGDDLGEAHAHLDLSEVDFAAVAGHLDDALAECGVADDDREPSWRRWRVSNRRSSVGESRGGRETGVLSVRWPTAVTER